MATTDYGQGVRLYHKKPESARTQDYGRVGTRKTCACCSKRNDQEGQFCSSCAPIIVAAAGRLEAQRAASEAWNNRIRA